MQLLRSTLLSVAIFSLILTGVPTVSAVTDIPPEVINRVKLRCIENLSSLNRLHLTDAFLRNDRGDLYRTISDKLMVPLNRRLASNQVDAGPLLKISADFNQEYSRFSSGYIGYDVAMTKLLAIDCKNEPVAFYSALVDARDKRASVAKSDAALKELIRQYGAAFTELKATYERANP